MSLNSRFDHLHIEMPVHLTTVLYDLFSCQIETSNEPLHEKTNKMLRRKQMRRS